MKAGQIYLILVVLLITHGTCYLMGRNAESRDYENQIDLTFEAAAQQYKTYYDDSTKFDQYGNKLTRRTAGTKTDTVKQILPKNSRTESHLPTTKKDSDISQTRKRN